MLLGLVSSPVDWETNIKAGTDVKLLPLRGMLLLVLFTGSSLALLVPVQEVKPALEQWKMLSSKQVGATVPPYRKGLCMGLALVTFRVKYIFMSSALQAQSSQSFCCIKLSVRNDVPVNLFLLQGLICPKAIWNASKFQVTAWAKQLKCCQWRQTCASSAGCAQFSYMGFQFSCMGLFQLLRTEESDGMRSHSLLHVF